MIKEITMNFPQLSVTKHQEIYQITQVGSAIGNADLLKGMFDDSRKFWNAAIDATSGAHLIEGVVMNNESKAAAITDYALQLSNLFITSRHPTLSLMTKRAYSLNTEHRKSVIYRMAALRFQNNEELFRAVVADLLCFDPFIVSMALTSSKEERTRLLAKFIASANGDYLAEEDWNPTHEELVENLLLIDFNDKREELINACLQNSIGTAHGVEIYQLINHAVAQLAGK